MSPKYDPCFIMDALVQELVSFVGINDNEVIWIVPSFTEIILILKGNVQFASWPCCF